MTQIDHFSDTTEKIHWSLRFTRSDVADYVIAILTGKLKPKQSKSGKWYLDFGPVAIEADDPADFGNTEDQARSTIEALEEFVVDDDEFYPPLEEEYLEEGAEKAKAPDPSLKQEECSESESAFLKPNRNTLDPDRPQTRTDEERTDETPAKPDSEAAPITDRPAFPEPDGNQLEIFIEALFRHCSNEGFVSLRSFYHDGDKPSRITPTSLKGGLKFLMEAAEDDARRAANNPKPVVFCPPIAVFNNAKHAREEDLLEGPVLSVELDENPRAALAKLEQLLGPATLVVRSGGKWTNPTTGEVEDKLHAYWRLKEPAQGEDLIKLKDLRRRATELVGGDPSNIPINHPIRWPGSWHRKGTPRLCEIVSTEHIDNEIDLDVALAALEAVAPQPHEEFGFTQKNAGSNDGEAALGFEVPPGLEAEGEYEKLGESPHSSPNAEPGLIAAALTVIPNSKRLLVLRGLKIDGSEGDDLDWHGWNSMGMAAWNATSGSAEGFAAFDAWSKKSPKYNAQTTAERWKAYSKCPPTQIGAGTIFYLANKASPSWREEYEAREQGGGDDDGGTNTTSGIPRFNTTPTPDQILPFRRHDEKPPLDDRAWAVEGLIPEVGTGVIAGQWGMLKTFVALDLAQCIMTGRPFINQFNITRPGGVLMFALEGQSEVPIRIQGVLEQKGNEYHKGAPFYWCEACPPLINPKTADPLIATAKAVAAEFKQRFNLPLTLILIDSLIAGAGYTKEGQDNDAVLAHAVKKIADKVSQALGCFVFIIDHFGKDVSTGTRGSSVKEVDADVIVACLGKRSEAGEITNSTLAIRKRRAGPTGEEFPFKGRIVDMGLNPHTGRMETTLVIDWDHRAAAHPTKPKNEWGRSKGVKLLRRIIMNLMADCGEPIKPFANGPLVRALKVSLVEAEFLKSYVTVGETEKAKKDAKRKAFQRAVDAAGDNLTTREVGSIDYIWLVNPSPAENLSAQPKPRKPLTQAKSKSDDLLYTGPVVEIPDLGPDSLDEHGQDI